MIEAKEQTAVTEHTIELDIGYIDSKGVRHTRVTFGHRITGKTLFALDNDPQSQIQTQYNDLLLRAAITEFGTMKMPVPLKVLLGLDSVDRDDLVRGHNDFTTQSLLDPESGEQREPQQLGDSIVKLAVGWTRNGLTYDVIEFGPRLTGMDEVAADRLKLTGVTRVCYLAGKQVKRFYQREGTSELPGPLGLEIFEDLDAVDVSAIRVGSEVWRNSFRRIREAIPGNGGAHDPAAGGADRLERSRNRVPVTRPS